MATSLFEPDGDLFVPTTLARGPWTEQALHGGPVAALMARALEHHEPQDSLLVRLTLEIMRPVPMAPLAVKARTTRPGKKVQLVEAALSAGDVELCRATALRIRSAEVELPSYVAAEAHPPPFPEQSSVPGIGGGWEAFHNAGVEMRNVKGTSEKMGPATAWIRLVHPVVPSEAPSPVQRAAAAADFGNGVSATLEWKHYLFINPDLTVYLHRPPRGEWICLDAVTRPQANGVGLAQSALYDRDGEIGRSAQALLLERR